eukprot:15478406-Alexandrium_andersonii.AAC.1
MSFRAACHDAVRGGVPCQVVAEAMRITSEQMTGANGPPDEEPSTVILLPGVRLMLDNMPECGNPRAAVRLR